MLIVPEVPGWASDIFVTTHSSHNGGGVGSGAPKSLLQIPDPRGVQEAAVLRHADEQSWH